MKEKAWLCPIWIFYIIYVNSLKLALLPPSSCINGQGLSIRWDYQHSMYERCHQGAVIRNIGLNKVSGDHGMSIMMIKHHYLNYVFIIYSLLGEHPIIQEYSGRWMIWETFSSCCIFLESIIFHNVYPYCFIIQKIIRRNKTLLMTAWETKQIYPPLPECS